jgi:hypothetical protein
MRKTMLHLGGKLVVYTATAMLILLFIAVASSFSQEQTVDEQKGRIVNPPVPVNPPDIPTPPSRGRGATPPDTFRWQVSHALVTGDGIRWHPDYFLWVSVYIPVKHRAEDLLIHYDQQSLFRNAWYRAGDKHVDLRIDYHCDARWPVQPISIRAWRAEERDHLNSNVVFSLEIPEIQVSPYCQ